MSEIPSINAIRHKTVTVMKHRGTMSTETREKYLRPDEACEYIGERIRIKPSAATLATMRTRGYTGDKPGFRKVFGRVVYPLTELNEYCDKLVGG